MKTYSQSPHDVIRTIERMRQQFHVDLDGVDIGALFVFDLEATEPVLKHQGYPAAATVRILPVQQRALGSPDALIVVDRYHWLTLGPAQRDALIDHELQHLERATEPETDLPDVDVLGRPRLKIRPHDFQIGAFEEVIARHGAASPEMRAVKAMTAAGVQTGFDFGPAPGGYTNASDVDTTHQEAA